MANSSTTQFKQSLGLLDATMLVSGAMIGSGIFIVSADMARILGSTGWLLVAWILTGVVTVAAALSYGELAGMMPKAGGQYIYIQRAFGPLASFVYGWTVFMVIQTGTIAAVAVAFTKYSAVFFPKLNFQNAENVLFNIGPVNVYWGTFYAIVCIILLTFINTRGVNAGKLIQNIFTSTKLLALFGLILIGIGYGLQSGVLQQNFQNAWEASRVSKETGEITMLSGMALIVALGVAMIGSLFSSDAWNNVTFIAAEIKNPKKNIPLSLLLGTLVVTVLYVLANVAYLCILPLKGSSAGTDVMAQGIQFAEYPTDRVATAAMSVIFGSASVGIMAVLIMISTFGCINGLILAGARLYYAMAQDGLFLKQASSLNARSVPGKALWVQCIWAGLLCLSGSYNQLLNYCTFGSLLFYMVTITGIFVLRRREPDTERPYKAVGYPFVPLFYIVVTLGICLILLSDANTRFDTGMGLLIVALGIPVYYFTGKQKN
ncbi:APC family permease [Runella slithyformis]|uniref:Amino acid permease-associated region n=1 Tax=Runella slithyformis (strain ATCC 29530 / DSM 19594 / LMG 11500 / NCIMB 11436 / LSU 4) TaxID=761193 RepID=A0A7U4E757_RUNSL|nr:amino acid permease [Runella slithyformis]AEI50313.1 amino acid permease-associated region [Runella slithyformis DSM 19594]